MGAGRTELAMSLFGRSYGRNITGKVTMGGKVAVSEIDDLKAFEAAWDGYRVGGIVDLV